MDKDYKELEPILRKLLKEGHTWYGKFTCGYCGSRQTFTEPNMLFTQGICEECKKTTDLTKWGFLVVMSNTEGIIHLFDE